MDAAKIRKMFLRDEGLRLKPYLCTAGKTSIGFGRNLSDVGISERTAEQMLAEDVIRAERSCVAIFGSELWNKWGDNRRLGWVNIAYNLGTASLLSFKATLKAAHQEDWELVRSGIRSSLYAKQVGVRSDRVISMICDEGFPYE